MALTQNSICAFGWKARDFGLKGIDSGNGPWPSGANAVDGVLDQVEDLTDADCHLCVGRPPRTAAKTPALRITCDPAQRRTARARARTARVIEGRAEPKAALRPTDLRGPPMVPDRRFRRA
jgi:hypothetical protein